jgi:hypothetical protein
MKQHDDRHRLLIRKSGRGNCHRDRRVAGGSRKSEDCAVVGDWSAKKVPCSKSDASEQNNENATPFPI